MSKYSGRCDCADIVSIKEIQDFSKLKVFVPSNDLIPLRIDSYKEIVPYFPYMGCVVTYDADGNTNVHLSRESYVDREEKEQLSWDLDVLKRYFRKCRRDKTEFNEEEALKQITLFGGSDHHKELVRRVKENGYGATIDGIHKPQHDYYRQTLYEEMLRVGWTEDQAYRWCFGLERWLRRINADKYGEGTVQQRLPG